MSGREDVDRCPFCNAEWGECSHVRMLAELESEAADRMSRKWMAARNESSGKGDYSSEGPATRTRSDGD